MKLKKHLLIIMTFCLSLLFMTSCSDINDDEDLPAVTLPPASDYPAVVGSLTFNEAPVSAACLSPALTEIICELGYGDLIVGITSYCDYPDDIKGRSTIGSSANPDFASITEMKPQLLITQSPIAKKDISSIENAGTRVLILSAPTSVEELYQSYADMAMVFGGKLTAVEKAESSCKELKTALAGADGTFDSFAYIMTDDCAVATGDTFAGDFLSCFGENVADKGKNLEFSTKELLKSNPEYIILASPLKAKDLPEGLQGLDAVKKGRVITIDSTLLERPTSRLTALVDDIKSQAGGTEKAAQTSVTESTDESETAE